MSALDPAAEKKRKARQSVARQVRAKAVPKGTYLPGMKRVRLSRDRAVTRWDAVVRNKAQASQYDNSLVRACIDAMNRNGQQAAARAISARLGIPYKTVKNWHLNSKLPAKGALSFAGLAPVMMAARDAFNMGLARSPMRALWEAVTARKLSWGRWKNFLSMGTIPTPTGFPLYEDPEIQAAAEARWIALSASNALPQRQTLERESRRSGRPRVREVRVFRTTPRPPLGAW